MKPVQTEIGRVYADIVGKTEEGRTVYSILSVPYAQGKRFEYAKILNKKTIHRKQQLTERRQYAFRRENIRCF